jgi:hypothetical protein
MERRRVAGAAGSSDRIAAAAPRGREHRARWCCSSVCVAVSRAARAVPDLPPRRRALSVGAAQPASTALCCLDASSAPLRAGQVATSASSWVQPKRGAVPDLQRWSCAAHARCCRSIKSQRHGRRARVRARVAALRCVAKSGTGSRAPLRPCAPHAPGATHAAPHRSASVPSFSVAKRRAPPPRGSCLVSASAQRVGSHRGARRHAAAAAEHVAGALAGCCRMSHLPRPTLLASAPSSSEARSLALLRGCAAAPTSAAGAAACLPWQRGDSPAPALLQLPAPLPPPAAAAAELIRAAVQAARSAVTCAGLRSVARPALLRLVLLRPARGAEPLPPSCRSPSCL